jgi:DNA-binding XRE family transcriptional regulator
MSMEQVQATTQFGRWRRECGLSKAQAARLLGKTWVHVNRLEKGHDYDGTPMRPPESLRRLMSIIAQDRPTSIEPWPA